MPIVVLKPTAGAAPPPSPTAVNVPTVTGEISFTTNPGDLPSYTDVSTYLRNASTSRGRNYEYDRTETGTAQFLLSNRDSRFNPENTAGPYYPNLKPTRRCRLRAVWEGVTHDLIVGFTKGYPQEFPGMGFDAVVAQRASDLFYRLNMTKFQPGSTTLIFAILTTPAAGTEEVIYGWNTGLPMPQKFPFVIKVGEEQMQVIGRDLYNPGFSWVVNRGHNDTNPQSHLADATVTTLEVTFAEELSGTRIRNVLERAGILATDMDIGAGQSMIAASDDLAGQNMLAHVQEIAEAENGRLFVSKAGRFTFRDRHWILENEQTDRATFSDQPGGIAYTLTGPIFHDDQLIANVVRVTPDSGNTKTASDQTSIDENFERVLEKSWPLARDVDAESAAEWMLGLLKDVQLRIPAVTFKGARDPTVMWPVLLGMEIGQRYAFSYTPKGGGTAITRSVIVEGLEHDVAPAEHRVTVQFSPANTLTYWRLGLTGYSELGSTTRLSF